MAISLSNIFQHKIHIFLQKYTTNGALSKYLAMPHTLTVLYRCYLQFFLAGLTCVLCLEVHHCKLYSAWSFSLLVSFLPHSYKVKAVNLELQKM